MSGGYIDKKSLKTNSFLEFRKLLLFKIGITNSSANIKVIDTLWLERGHFYFGEQRDISILV